MENRFFCTYFDKNYLYRGLVLHSSMLKHIKHFTLYILCLDGKTYEILDKMNLDSVKLIRMTDFEDDRLKQVKGTRSTVEYYWTCTPSLPLYVFKIDKEIDIITYLDSDLMFFSSLEVVFEEFGDSSILAVEHRFSRNVKESTALNGKYCVQYLSFRRDKEGLACLERWRDQCISWCYYRQEDGMMGDQAYLTEWDDRYPTLHSVENIGAGLAPWNIFNYNLTEKDGEVLVNKTRLVFFHYHALRMYSERTIDPAEGYVFPKEHRTLVYQPYFRELKRAISRVKEIDSSFHSGYSRGILNVVLFRLRYLLKPWLPFLFKK